MHPAPPVDSAERFSYKLATHEEVLEDLSRYINSTYVQFSSYAKKSLSFKSPRGRTIVS